MTYRGRRSPKQQAQGKAWNPFAPGALRVSGRPKAEERPAITSWWTVSEGDFAAAYARELPRLRAAKVRIEVRVVGGG